MHIVTTITANMRRSKCSRDRLRQVLEVRYAAIRSDDIRTSEHDKHMPRWSNAARKAIILSNDTARLKEESTFSKNDLKILTDDQLITVGMMSKKPLAGTQQPIAKKLDLVTPWGKSLLSKMLKTWMSSAHTTKLHSARK
jgi:hypothetical protein